MGGGGREGQFNRSTFDEFQLFKMSKILSVKSIFRENYHKYSTKIVFGWGSPQTPLGELTTLPQTP